MDSEDHQGYFQAEAHEHQLLKDVKSHKKPTIESLRLLAQYCISSNHRKNYLEKAISAIGSKKFTDLLNLTYSTDLLTLDDATNVEIFSFLGLILTQNHIDEINQWVTLCFSPLIWLRLSRLYLKNLFLAYPKFLKDYESLIKNKHTAAETQASTFLENVLKLFCNKFSSLSFDLVDGELKVCEKVLEFLIITVSTPLSRLATIQLMQDRQFFIKNQMFLRYLQMKYDESADKSKLNNLDRFMRLLKRFINFDIMGESRIAKRTILVHYDTFQEFQRLLFHHFSEKVEHYVIKSVGSADTREKLMEIFSYLTEEDLRLIANRLNIFVPEEDASDPVLSILTEEKGFKVIVEEILVFKLKSRESMLTKIKSQPLFPTQNEIWSDANRQFSFKGKNLPALQSLAIDRITLSFINVEDYLIRYFNLWRHAFALDIKDTLEIVVPQLQPLLEFSTGQVQEFKGWTQDTMEIKEFTIFEVEKPKIGKQVPESILAEVLYSTIDINSSTKQGWEKIKVKDTLFMLSFRKAEKNPKAIENELEEKNTEINFAQKFNLAQVRGCELIGHLDEERQKIHAAGFKIQRDIKPRGTSRYLQMHMDPHQYALDLRGDSNRMSTRNSAFNIVVKSKVGSPNFKAYLTLITKFLEQHIEVADWILSAIMGKPYSQESLLAQSPSDTKLNLDGLFADESQMKETLTSNQDLKDLAQHFNDKASTYRSDGLNLNPAQLSAVIRSQLPGIHLIEAAPGTGKSLVVKESIKQSLANYPDHRILIVSRSSDTVTRLLNEIESSVGEDLIMRLDAGPKDAVYDFSQLGRVNHVLKRRLELLEKVQEVAKSVGLELHTQLTCETAEILFKSQFLSRWSTFESEYNSKNPKKSDQIPRYPFASNMSITLDTKLKPAELFSLYQEHYLGLKKLFDELSQTRVMELLRYNQERAKYLLNYHCKVIACPASHLILNNEMLLDSKFKVGTIIVMEAGQISDFETFSAILSSKGLERVVMIGDQKQSAPVVLNSTLETTARLSCSMFSRLLSLGHKSVKLTHQGKARPDIYDCLRWNYSEVLDLARVTEDSIYKAECPGLKHHCQIIDIQSQEHHVKADYIQNLDEAEYSVAFFMYLVIQGIEPSRISILTATQAQSDLIQEIIIKKTSWHKSFGKPGSIGYLMESQSLTNDYVILSLVRSQDPGILAEADSTAVALSHARLGLFVLCNVDLFKKVEHFKHALSAVKDKTHKLIVKDQKKDKPIANYEELYKLVQDLFQKHQESQPTN